MPMPMSLEVGTQKAQSWNGCGGGKMSGGGGGGGNGVADPFIFAFASLVPPQSLVAPPPEKKSVPCIDVVLIPHDPDPDHDHKSVHLSDHRSMTSGGMGFGGDWGGGAGGARWGREEGRGEGEGMVRKKMRSKLGNDGGTCEKTGKMRTKQSLPKRKAAEAWTLSPDPRLPGLPQPRGFIPILPSDFRRPQEW